MTSAHPSKRTFSNRVRPILLIHKLRMLVLNHIPRLVHFRAMGNAGTSEVLLLEPNLGHNNLMCLSCRYFRAEQSVHCLQGNTFGLWNEKPNKNDRDNHQRGEEEVNPKAHSCKHLGGEACDDEVPELFQRVSTRFSDHRGGSLRLTQLFAAAKACARVLTFWSNISELRTQGVPFQVGE
jgi:hypothetical protein